MTKMQAVHKVFSTLSFSFSIWAERWNVWAARKANGRSTVRKVRTLTLKHPPLVTTQYKFTERKWEPVHVDHKCVFMWHSTCYTFQSSCLFILTYSSQNWVCVFLSLFWRRCRFFHLGPRSWLGIHYVRLQKLSLHSSMLKISFATAVRPFFVWKAVCWCKSA